MLRLRSHLAVVAAALVSASCGSSTPYFTAEEEPWRESAEIACLNSGYVRESAFVETQRSSLGGPSPCGAEHPFKVSAALGGRVGFKPAATLQCGMIPAIDRWMAEVVQPAAQRNFGMGVVEATVLSSYACRPRNNVHGAKLSEHGHANAIDIGAFRLADGRKVTVLSGWNGAHDEQAFLREVRRGACGIFKTVLGPGSDRNHANHFHLDLARHNRKGTAYCK
ncbi:MAG: extensin family protein [Hyphomicrobiaceae bacterium]